MAQITVREYARVKGVSVAAIHRQIKTGKVKATRRGRAWVIDLADGTEANTSTNPSGMAPGELDEANPVGDGAALLRAKVQKEQAMARLKDMEAKQRAGELVEASQVEKMAADCARKVRNNLTRIPGKCAAEWAAETDPHKLEILMDAEIRAALEELADEIDEDGEPEDGGDE